MTNFSDRYTHEQIEYGFGVVFGSARNAQVYCPYCEDESSKTPSCSVSVEGLFKCHGKCQSKGNVVEFFARVHSLTPIEAEEAIEVMDDGRRIRRTVVARHEVAQLDGDTIRDMIERSHSQLMGGDAPNRNDRFAMLRKYLREERGLNDRTLIRYEIGADEYRLTIPVYWGEEVPGIRQYLPNAAKGKKIRYNRRSLTATRLYPFHRYDALVADPVEEGDFVILCEGEWDCMLLEQNGYKAITTTAGVTNWKDEWYQMIADALRGRSLVVMYDVNDKEDVGQKMARRRATELAKLGVPCYIAKLPLEERGGDVTDFFVKHRRTVADMNVVIERAFNAGLIEIDTFQEADMTVPPDMDDHRSDEKPMGLIDAMQTRSVGTEVAFQAQVVAKADAPYRVPSHFVVEWTEEEVVVKRTVRLEKTDPRLLALLGIETTKQLGIMKAWVGAPKGPKSDATVSVHEYLSIEELYISPVGTDMKGAEDRQVPPAYSVGLGIAPNVTYRFTGTLAPRPKDQHASFLLWKASIDGTDIDSVDLDDDDLDDIRGLVGNCETVEQIEEKLFDIADDHARSRTSVYGRPDLHVLIDLAYHSVLRFSYGAERNIRGRLDVGIFGDTRTGKSQAAERLQQFYGVGSMMLCENKATASGIMGGVSKINGSFVIKPGRIPLAHRRLLICDEMNQLSTYEIGNLTGVRSSGEVRIEKIVHGVFPAETRLIWLSNPRGDELDSYCYGIEMVRELIGDSADIARFDVVLIVSAADVKRESIYAAMRSPRSSAKYSQAALRNLVMWSWSRRSDQVKFDDAAVDAVYTESSILSRKIHQSMPLLLEAEARHKVARLALAIAARLFSSPDGEVVEVKRAHVIAAVRFLTRVYSSPSCGMIDYSTARLSEEALVTPELIKRMIPKEAFGSFAQYVLSSRELSRDGLMIAAGLDHLTIFQFMHTLQKCGAIRPSGRYSFTRTKAFRIYLTRCLEEGSKHDNTTQEHSDD